MDKYWIEKAHKYITKHNAFNDVSEIDDSSSISSTISVNLPNKFVSTGITDIGVRSKEYVKFVFPDTFPLKAPTIYLREDFPKFFPHINPSSDHVIPCIYEGDLSELLQQSEWMFGILNQLVDWLEKAASNELLDYEQGWEPMRNDIQNGWMSYEIDDVLSAFKECKNNIIKNEIIYEECNSKIFAGSICDPRNAKQSHAIYAITTDIVKKYVPNLITNLSHLYKYADFIGLRNLKKCIEDVDLSNINEDKIFVILAVKRPVNIINKDSNIEFLNFVIHKSKHRKNKGKEKKRTIPECVVEMITHVTNKSPSLLKRISGTNTILNERKKIALVGCGSLGSKIGIHLARNGNGPFKCIDKDTFMPHNNTRHGLTLTLTKNKAELLSISICSIVMISTESDPGNVYNSDFGNTRIIIDSTASFSVRNFLMKRIDLPPIITCALYNKGQKGLLISEDYNKSTGLTVIWGFLYFKSLDYEELNKTLFTSEHENISIGESCSSQTMTIDDASISLMTSAMSINIQRLLENNLSKNAEVMFLQRNVYSLNSEVFKIPSFIKIQQKDDWITYISSTVLDDMRELMLKKIPNETGGVLLGSVFLYPKTIVIAGIIKAPPDSIEKPNLFILGVDGLEKIIKNIEVKTRGKVTYLGTWHSHPNGGEASGTDCQTFKKLLFVRDYEPTVCLIVTEDNLIMV